MTMKKKSIIIYLLLLFVASSIVISVIIYFISRPLEPEFQPAFANTGSTKSMLTNYDVKIKKFDKDHAVLFKNVVSSTGDHDNHYFKVDILIVTNNKESAKVLKNNHKSTVLVISGTLINFKRNEVNSIEGKNFLKEKIKRELERKYGYGVIKAIFFENFIIS